MRKSNRIVSILLGILVCIATVAIVRAELKAHSEEVKPNLKLSFSVLSDIHSGEIKLDYAIKDLHSINPRMDAMVLNGDTVDQGLDEQYGVISRCLTLDKPFLPGRVIKTIGNHEFYNYKKGVNTPKDVEAFVSRFLAFSNEKKVYYDTWINDYHFICLGSEKCYTPELGTVRAYISTEQQKWLEEKLSEKYKPKKPIFIFLHQPINETVMGKNIGSNNVKAAQMSAILSKYPEAILFTSHTHYSLDLPGSFIQKGFSIMNTGSVQEPLKPDGHGGDRRIGGSQGLYVEVYEDKVIIRGREFSKKDWIDKAYFIIDLKQAITAKKPNQ